MSCFLCGTCYFAARFVECADAAALPLGHVARAQKAHIGEPALTEGSTIYSGDYVSTEDGGSVLIRIGESSLGLQSASAAHVYRTPYGAVVELNHGTAFFTTPGGHEMRVGSESHT